MADYLDRLKYRTTKTDVQIRIERITNIERKNEKENPFDILPPYSMRGPKRGVVLVINNIDFENSDLSNKLEERNGADVDAENLKKLFVQMGFIWIYWENQTRKQIKENLKKFTDYSNKTLSEVDSCFVFVMSHGTHEDKFFTYDNLKVKSTDILDRFDNSNCQQLRGKPKVIIFQMCRGELEDQLILNERLLAEQYDVPECQMDMEAQILTTDNTTSPRISDILICYSTSPGFRSFRDPKGSWFIRYFCEVFMTYSCNMDVENLLKIVAMKVSKQYTEYNALQIPRIENILFREFYLYPLSEKTNYGFHTWWKRNKVLIFLGVVIIILNIYLLLETKNTKWQL
ncbi:caspase-6-like [Chrysoperla carnea]|uniref:caspase-6-like n=1 Tax=Chrysoperla carnea TaxID=189513 RepID=UPI001D09154E|nr:caspase-6-like [Chrysoperla carnea]